MRDILKLFLSFNYGIEILKLVLYNTGCSSEVSWRAVTVSLPERREVIV